MFKIGEKIKIVQIFLLAIVLIFVFFIVYSPHLYYDYPYPLHYDEWIHIGEAKRFITTGTSDVLDLPGSNGSIHRLQNALGFDIFLAEIEIMTGLDLVKIFQFLPAFFAVICALLLFILIFQITNSYLAAIVSMILFSLLPSNINFLGIWFLLPSTFSFLFIFLLFYLLIKYFNDKEKKILYLIYLLGFVFSTIYPITILFLLPIVLVSFFINNNLKSFVKFSFWYMLYSFFIIVAINLIFLLVQDELVKGAGSTKDILMGVFIYLKNWSPFLAYKYFLPSVFGFFPTLLALTGLVYSIRDRRKNLVVFLLAWVTINLFLYEFFEFTLLLFYQRILYLGLITLIILASIGFGMLAVRLKKVLDKKLFIFRNTFFLFIIFISLFFTFYEPIKNYYKLEPNVVPVTIIKKEDTKALEYLKTQYYNKVVLTNFLFSIVIYPATGNYVLYPYLELRDTAGDIAYDIYSNFVKREDGARKKIVEQYKIDIVYSSVYIESEILKLVYSKNNRFIYEVVF